MPNSKIVWTKIDEAPALATYALLPIVQAYTKGTGIDVEARDISLAGRIIANFPGKLSPAQKLPDALLALGDLAKTPEANIIKLPNISASIPQLQAALKELQEHGYDVPGYPEEPKTEEDKALQLRFTKVLGSAVNPVLREGNSDRRAAASVKKFAQKNPHRMMKDWPKEGSKTRVAHMSEKDFFGSEKSVTLGAPTEVRLEFTGTGGEVKVLKEGLGLLAGEVIDAAVMNVAALRKFYAKTIDEAGRDGTLLSLHLKATMMKISDPVMFGHCVSVFYAAALDKHAATLAEIGAWPASSRSWTGCRRRKRPRSRPTSPPSTPRARPSPWSTRGRASPTCTCPTTPSSTPRCPTSCATAVACGTGTTSCRTPWP